MSLAEIEDELLRKEAKRERWRALAAELRASGLRTAGELAAREGCSLGDLQDIGQPFPRNPS
ncbi:MAG: hypothetical protein ACHQC8_03525 [Solirubrobacterales bacterium]